MCGRHDISCLSTQSRSIHPSIHLSIYQSSIYLSQNTHGTGWNNCHTIFIYHKRGPTVAYRGNEIEKQFKKVNEFNSIIIIQYPMRLTPLLEVPTVLRLYMYLAIDIVVLQMISLGVSGKVARAYKYALLLYSITPRHHSKQRHYTNVSRIYSCSLW